MRIEQKEYVEETPEYVNVCVGISQWQSLDGYPIREKDCKVAGEVWRVHKGDADPFPSIPHAHCIAGSDRFVGCKLHLGTGELFKKRNSLKRRLELNKFQRLIELIQPKFPNIKLPLENK